MAALDILTNLPESLACCILRDWLNCKTVKALNAAYGCKFSREMFLNLLQSNEYFIRDRVIIASSSNIMSALQIVGEKFRSIQFVDRLSHEQRKLVAAQCRNLTSIYYTSATKMKLRSVLKANRDIEHLEISQINLRFWFMNFPVIPRFKGISLPKLHSLALKGLRDVDGQILHAMRHGHIVRLDLFYSRILDTTLMMMATLCPRLRSLGLAMTEINDTQLIELSHRCPHIAHIDISGNHHITDAGILGMLQHLQGLQSVNISNIYNITNASLVNIYTYCADTLHTLYVHTDRHSQLQDGSVINDLLERCTQMRVFHSDVNCVFSSIAVCNLTSLLLYDINLPCAQNLTTIGTYCTQLLVLGLGGIKFCTLQGLLAICTGCTKLKKLYLDLDLLFLCDREEDYDRTEFVKFAIEMWKKVRPGLLIEKVVFLPFNVMDIA